MNRIMWVLIALGMILAVMWSGCRLDRKGSSVVSRPARDISSVLKDHAAGWMEMPGVVMVAEGKTASGQDCLRIYVKSLTPELQGQLPDTVEGYPVEIEESGEIKPLGGG